MAAGQHASSQIAAFLGTGETRLIAAAYRDPARRGELFVLEDDKALELRTWAKQNLRCMFDDCPVPDLTTVSRANKRDGFRHGKGGHKHTPESVNHRQGKAVVANWLREAYPDARVELELATDTQRSNVADVMLILASGQRVAFEVQYAALSVAEWRRRHESYARQGVIDIWLWGHTRVRTLRGSDAYEPFWLEDVQAELLSHDMRVTFLNPETAQLGIATNSWGTRECLAYKREYQLRVHALADARPSPKGVNSPLISQLIEATKHRLKEQEQFEQEWEAGRADRERERAGALAKAAAEEEARALKAAAAEQSKRDQETAKRDNAANDARRSAQFRKQLTIARRAAGRRPTGPIDPVIARERKVCRECGEPLDPMFVELGVHPAHEELRKRLQHEHPPREAPIVPGLWARRETNGSQQDTLAGKRRPEHEHGHHEHGQSQTPLW